MKKLWLGILATLLVVVFVAPSFAWEFSMTGDFETRFRYFGRADGSKDLFGDMNIQNNPNNTLGSVTPTGGIAGPANALVGFAGPNFYRGYNGGTVPMLTAYTGTSVRIVRSGFSLTQSDAFQNDMRMNIIPVIRVNNAIRISANVDFAGITNKYNHRDVSTNGPFNRWYQDRVSANGFDTAMIPSINQLKLTVQMPWGVLSYGLAKDFPLGTGAMLAHNSRASALVLVLPYGPFRLVPSIWLARNTDGYSAFSPYAPDTSLLMAPTGPRVATDQTYVAPGEAVTNYDSGVKNRIYWGPFLTYSEGPIEFSAMWVHQMLHYDAAYTRNAGTRTIYPNGPGSGTFASWLYGGADTNLSVYIFALKYNNGRFFANAEYGFGHQDVTYLTNPTREADSGAPPLYTEISYGFAEAGALCGPAKLGFMFGWSPGQVLNNSNSTKAYLGGAINYQATDAYNYLMFKTYGGGNDAPWNTASGLAFTRDENGQMGDAYTLAGRLDYAAAANLNIWGSYMWAHRVEQNGFYAGGKDSGGTGTASTTRLAAQNWKSSVFGGAAGNYNPYVDDGYLGWEANLGVDWKLLENFSSKFRYAYWQPGPWFDQAYRVVGLVGGAVSPNAQMTGRSAIQAFEGSVVVDF